VAGQALSRQGSPKATEGRALRDADGLLDSNGPLTHEQGRARHPPPSTHSVHLPTASSPRARRSSSGRLFPVKLSDL
jgi:hypothetical protein